MGGAIEILAGCSAKLLRTQGGAAWFGSLLDGGVRFILHADPELQVHTYELSALSHDGKLLEASGMMIEDEPVHSMEQAVIVAGKLCRMHFRFLFEHVDGVPRLLDIRQKL